MALCLYMMNWSVANNRSIYILKKDKKKKKKKKKKSNLKDLEGYKKIESYFERRNKRDKYHGFKKVAW